MIFLRRSDLLEYCRNLHILPNQSYFSPDSPPFSAVSSCCNFLHTNETRTFFCESRELKDISIPHLWHNHAASTTAHSRAAGCFDTLTQNRNSTFLHQPFPRRHH